MATVFPTSIIVPVWENIFIVQIIGNGLLAQGVGTISAGGYLQGFIVDYIFIKALVVRLTQPQQAFVKVADLIETRFLK